MDTTVIATSSIVDAMRASLLKMQTNLANAQKEATTGRLADVGQSLGIQTGQTVSLRLELARLGAITDTNKLVQSRLDTAQAALKSIVDDAQTFVGQLLAARNAATGPTVVQDQAKSALNALIDQLNATLNGEYLFSGINSDVKPMNAYFQNPPSAAAQAVAGAFTSAFGTTQSDPANQSITGAQMSSFLDNGFANLFNDAGWKGTWSAASDQNAKSRISTSELIDTSTNTNQQPFRQLASAYTMIADLGVTNLNSAAFQTVVDKAVQVAGQAVEGLSTIEASLGTAQQRIATANDRMSIQVNIITNQINGLESVDPAEASTRVSSLLTQIDTAYAVTARIEQLSLLKYLPIA